jgi:glutamyl-tRNA synthetase
LFSDPLPALTDADRHWLKQAGTAFFQAALAGYEQHGADYLALIEALKARTGVRGKALFMPLRIALTGIGHGPELARLLALLPPELVRRRLQAWC